MKAHTMHLLLVVVAVGGALLPGCGSRRPVYDESLETLGPFPVQGGLCYLNRSLGELTRLAVTEDGNRIERAYLAPAPRAVFEVTRAGAIAVLHDDEAAPGVTLLESVTLRETGWLPLGERFDRMALSPSGRYGLAHFSGAASGTAGGIRNLNQVQVLDFIEGVSFPPHALETGGYSPRGITFVPPGTSAEFEDIAVVLVNNGLVFIDTVDPNAEPLWVRFTNSPGGLSVPAQVVFGPFLPDGGYVYARLQGADDVLSVHLVREAGRLHRTINFLNVPAGQRPADLLVLTGEAYRDMILVVYGGSGGGAALLDANAIQTRERTFSFDAPVERARRLQAEDGSRELAAVYHPEASSGRLFIIDPETGVVETVHLQDAFDRLSGPDDGTYLVAFHPRLAQSGTPGLRVVRTEVHPVSGRLSHRIATYSLDFDLSGSAFRDQGATLLAALEGSMNAFILDLASGVYESVELDKTPISAGWVPGTAWTYFVHPHPLGSVTLIPVTHFDRDHAVLVEGFVLQGLLDPR